MREIKLFKCGKCGWIGERKWLHEVNPHQVKCPSCGNGSYRMPSYKNKYKEPAR